MKQLCPDVWFLNYTNPMAINCRAVNRATEFAPSGCATACRARRTSCPSTSASRTSEIDYLAAGINHMAFYLRFERDGEDLYPRLQELAEPGQCPRRTACATSCSPLRLFRHRVE